MRATEEQLLAFLAEHGERLHALFVRLTLRVDAAEDLMQDLFCKLAVSSAFAAADNRLAYGIRMAVNLAFDHRRSRRRLPVEVPADHAAIVSSPLANLVRREELERLLDAIARLPTGSREIIVLRYLEQEDFATIGRQIGKTPHQARGLCHKAIGRLRILLDNPASKASEARRTSE